MELMKDQDYLSQLLGRMQADCEYYLNYGHRRPAVLWAQEEKAQIKMMRRCYNELEIKPQWITLEDIAHYEKEMIQG